DVNGQERPTFRADHALMGIVPRPGDHQLTLHYAPPYAGMSALMSPFRAVTSAIARLEYGQSMPGLQVFGRSLTSLPGQQLCDGGHEPITTLAAETSMPPITGVRANLALGRPTVQSASLAGMDAMLAVDGKTDGDASHESVAQTA